MTTEEQVESIIQKSILGELFGESIGEEIVRVGYAKSLNQVLYQNGETILQKKSKAEYIYLVTRGILVESPDKNADCFDTTKGRGDKKGSKSSAHMSGKLNDQQCKIYHTSPTDQRDYKIAGGQTLKFEKRKF